MHNILTYISSGFNLFIESLLFIWTDLTTEIERSLRGNATLKLKHAPECLKFVGIYFKFRVLLDDYFVIQSLMQCVLLFSSTLLICADD
jgi:hypothetical protein